MAEKQNSYIAIDLKSFYASVECISRGLDPMTTNLVVADESRTEKTICLAVSPALKSYGIPGRPRLFEVIQRVQQVNEKRKRDAHIAAFTESSFDNHILHSSPATAVDYIIAKPRMAKYVQVSTEIYQVYLKYISPDDIHTYSIDEVFIDATPYLRTYGMTARELAMTMIRDVLATTGITATAGIGTNLYLCKIAMDIVAKHKEPDSDGVRIAELNEQSYREQLWSHRPLTDFWRIGKGYAKKLEAHGLYTMGDIARCSIGKSNNLYNEDLLYNMFGVNAELLIDHAWGWEPCTIKEIKAYQPQSNSISSGQVLKSPHKTDKARLIVWEMADSMALDLVEKSAVTDQLTHTLGYDRENLADPVKKKQYKGAIATDSYGRAVPKHAHGTINLEQHSSSTKRIVDAAMQLYDRIADPTLLIRRITLTANHVIPEKQAEKKKQAPVQMDLFTDYEAQEQQIKKEEEELAREKRVQEALIDIKRRYGKNAILKGANLQEGATAKERNEQIGGHKA